MKIKEMHFKNVVRYVQGPVFNPHQKKKKKKVKSMLNVKTFRESSGRGLKKDVY
jgi:nucleoside 2-deoxyribosyltransferase